MSTFQFKAYVCFFAICFSLATSQSPSAQDMNAMADNLEPDGTPKFGIVGPGESHLYRVEVTEPSDVTVIVEPTATSGVLGDIDLYCDLEDFGTPSPLQATWKSERGSGFDVVFISRNDKLALKQGTYICAVYGYSNYPTGYEIYAEVSPENRELNVVQQEAVRQIFQKCCGSSGVSNCLFWKGLGGANFTDLCHYPGSICDEEGNLSVLDLSREGMSCIFPSQEILQFQKLHTLILDYNFITGDVGAIGAALSELVDFKRLSLLQNSIEGNLDDPGVCAMVRAGLQALDLQANSIRGSIPDCLVGSERIEEIKLSANLLTGPIPPDGVWPTYPVESRLRTIMLASNRINGNIPLAVARLPSLVYLDLTSNFLEGELPQAFKAEFLQHIMLSGNQLSGPIPESLSSSSLLETVRMYGNNMSGPLPEQWSSKLTRLDLGVNSFSGSIPASLASLKELSLLWLDGNQLSGALPGADMEAPFPNTRIFNVSSNGLSGPIPESYSEMGVFTKPPTVLAGQLLYNNFDVSNNLLSGEIPDFLEEADYSDTTIVLLGGNQFNCPSETDIPYLQGLECVGDGGGGFPSSSEQDDTQSSDDTGGGLSGGAIAGIVIGCVVGVVLLGVSARYILKKKKASTSLRFVDVENNSPNPGELALT